MLTVTFALTYPIFFTDLKFSSTFLRDTIITIFFSVAIASIIQKGMTQRIVSILFVLAILFKCPLFDIYFPPTFDISEKIEIKKILFENYSLILERTKQPPDPEDDLYHWTGKKYYLGNIIYDGVSIDDSSNNNNKCVQTLYISRVNNYEKGYTTLERVVNYDTCKNEIISIERH
ncbi:MAG: hypothetical protein ABJB11_23640 [Ferruginibacter sp.]